MKKQFSSEVQKKMNEAVDHLLSFGSPVKFNELLSQSIIWLYTGIVKTDYRELEYNKQSDHFFNLSQIFEVVMPPWLMCANQPKAKTREKIIDNIVELELWADEMDLTVQVINTGAMISDSAYTKERASDIYAFLESLYFFSKTVKEANDLQSKERADLRRELELTNN